MQKYIDLTLEEKKVLLESLKEEYQKYADKKLSLNMARGKPGSDQLDISDGILTCVNHDDLQLEDDLRNYGILDGAKACKDLFSKVFDINSNELIIGGNSSLNLMYDTVLRALFFGVSEDATPWKDQGNIKFLCPSPGYDRHFAICEQFGIEMVIVPMDENGPKMDIVKELVENDDKIKGIWCVPKYSNPTGITYSDQVVDAFAALNPKATDFRIFWDNAYCIHHLKDEGDNLKDLFKLLKEQNKEDMLYMYSSTSKVTYPGAGISFFMSSEKNISYAKKIMSMQTIGSDKVNQIRHVKFFGDENGIYNHMKKHGDIIAPKFKTVIDALNKDAKELGICEYTSPNGGYFISVDTLKGCGKRTVELCKNAGVTLTPAGATYPYGRDPEDKNIRIAPTYPPLDELNEAMKIFVLSLKIASLEKLINE